MVQLTAQPLGTGCRGDPHIRMKTTDDTHHDQLKTPLGRSWEKTARGNRRGIKGRGIIGRSLVVPGGVAAGPGPRTLDPETPTADPKTPPPNPSFLNILHSDQNCNHQYSRPGMQKRIIKSLSLSYCLLHYHFVGPTQHPAKRGSEAEAASPTRVASRVITGMPTRRATHRGYQPQSSMTKDHIMANVAYQGMDGANITVDKAVSKSGGKGGSGAARDTTPIALLMPKGTYLTPMSIITVTGKDKSGLFDEFLSKKRYFTQPGMEVGGQVTVDKCEPKVIDGTTRYVVTAPAYVWTARGIDVAKLTAAKEERKADKLKAAIKAQVEALPKLPETHNEDGSTNGTPLPGEVH